MAVRAGSLSHSGVVALLRKYFVCAHLPELTTKHLVRDEADLALLRKYDKQTNGGLTAGEREVFFTPGGELVELLLSLNEGRKQYTLSVRQDPREALDRFFAAAARAWERSCGARPEDWEALRKGTAPEAEAVRRLEIPGPVREKEGLTLRVNMRHDLHMYEQLAGWERVVFSRDEAAVLSAEGEWPAASFRKLAGAFYPRGGGVHIVLTEASIRGAIRTIVGETTEGEVRGRFEGRFALAPATAEERSRRENYRPWTGTRGDLEGDFVFDRKTGAFTRFRLVARKATNSFSYRTEGPQALALGVEIVR